MSSVAAGRWSMVHVMAPALLAIASKARIAVHVRRVFFIEISSLLLTATNTRLSSFPRAIPSPPVLQFLSRLDFSVGPGFLHLRGFAGILGVSPTAVKRKNAKICSGIMGMIANLLSAVIYAC